jgi:hypothetical protein
VVLAVTAVPAGGMTTIEWWLACAGAYCLGYWTCEMGRPRPRPWRVACSAFGWGLAGSIILGRAVLGWT